MSDFGIIGEASRPADANIFVEKPLPNASSELSLPFQFGSLQGALELVVSLSGTLSVPATKNFSIELHGSDRYDGEYEKIADVLTVAGGASDPTAVEKGEVSRFAANSKTSRYCKLKVVTDFDASAVLLSSWCEYVAR